MNRLTPFAHLPEVKDAVISDSEGTLIEHTATDDAESVAAVMSFFVSGIADCGDVLGLGAPTRISCTGKELSCVLFIQNKMIWTVYLDPTTSQSAFEKKTVSLVAKNSQGMGGLK